MRTLGWRYYPPGPNRCINVIQRLASTTTSLLPDNKAYSETLLLPKTTFPLRADPLKSEVAFRRKTCDELYRWQWENAEGPLFILHDGPPYANGRLHMGHALNKILKDIINRYHVLLGHRVHYVPGWDCHGLPIENKALQELGKNSLSLPSATIRSAALATALREIDTQREEFKQLGIMADWHGERGTYRTLDHDYEMRQLRVFQNMVKKGLIYTAHRPVFYSPSSRSALAEAELEYSDAHVSTAVYLAFLLDLQGTSNPQMRELLRGGTRAEILVWTTTPWTLSANMGIAVHPELVYAVLRSVTNSNVMIVARERVDALSDMIGQVEDLGNVKGSDLVGITYHPLFPNSTNQTPNYKIIPASHVNSVSGTGLVHCAPAHGADDYNAFRTLGLLPRSAEMVCHVDLAGRFTEGITDILGEQRGRKLVGSEVLYEGGREMVKVLQELKPGHGGGRLVKEERVTHRYPYDWKTGKPIIVLATQQWFANLEGIKDKALAALKDVQFYPAASRKRLTSHVMAHPEWCISRQRVWGVPIPSLHHASGRVILDSQLLEHILGVLEKKGTTWWWDGPVEDFVPDSLKAEGEWRKGTDTMDVWFDSGTSWSMLRDEHTIRDERTFHADVCLEGSDQHRGWFQSSLLTAVSSSYAEEQGKAISSPYGTLITHGMVLDETGKKMSKSLGNVLSLMTIVNGGDDKKKDPAYGADVLRLWVATVEYSSDMNTGPTVLAGCVEMLRRIRNSARFILGNLRVGDGEPWNRVGRNDLGLAERYVMHELWKLESISREGYSSYNFSKVANALSNFANMILSSLYFDITKDCLYANAKGSRERRAVLTVLEQILMTMTSVMAPILPHLAEEIHHHFVGQVGDQVPGPSVCASKWEFLNPEYRDPQAEADMGELLRVRGVVLSLLEKARGQKQVRSSLEADVDLILPGDMSEGSKFLDLLQREEELLKTLFIVSNVSLIDEGSLGTSSPEWVYMGSLTIPDSPEELGVRVRPAELRKCPRCWTFTREEAEALCKRCANTVYPQTSV